MAPTAVSRDILATIVDLGAFSQHDLRLISLASPHLRYEAQRRLFKDPGPHSINVLSESESLNTASMFLEAVSSSPDRLALMVRRYRITLSWYDFRARYEREQKERQHRLFNHLSRALPLMVNLRELSYHEKLQNVSNPIPIPSPPPSIWTVFKRCTFKLQILSCAYISMKNRNAVVTFLRSQPSIQDLWLYEVPSPGTANTTSPQQSVFKDVCPSLLSLGGMPEIVAGMVSRRKTLQHMSWEKNDYATTIQYSPQLFSTTNVSRVELMESLRCGPPLSRICEVFKNLVVLKTCERDVFLNLDALKGLQRLRVLILDLEGGLNIAASLDNEEPVVRHTFSHLLSLDYLECHRHYGIALGRKYLIRRDTQVVTVYTLPRFIPLSSTEGRNELLRKVSAQVDGGHVFVKSFTIC